MYFILSLFFSLPIINKINANYSEIKTLRGRIKCHYEIGQDRKKTTGKFCFVSPDKLLIKYSNPARTVILKDNVLWECYPEENKVIKIDYKKLSELDKQSMETGVFWGLTPLYGIEKDFNFEFRDSILIAKPKLASKISKIVFELDVKKRLITDTKFFNVQDSLVSETSYNDWENEEGIWLPQDIVSEVYIDGKQRIEKVDFQGLSINYDIPDSIFNFTPPESVEVIEK